MSNPQKLSANFIVVGGGTSGCLVASRLASELPDKTVLLIEAGKDTRDLAVRSPEHRYMVPLLFPELDHGYMTVPQASLNNKQLPYLRGSGLGGSSVVNFMAYHYGPASEYDRWGNVVGDKALRWENVKPRLNKLETYNGIQEGHGKTGPIHISVLARGNQETNLVVESMIELGHSLHLDINSGNPIGVTMNPSSMGLDGRETSATAFLTTEPQNLDIIYETRVTRVDLAGNRAVGVTLEGGRVAWASEEVILCAGSIDSPKILLLSGIGNADELRAVGVQPKHNLPGVGKNLHDHVGVGIMHKMTGNYREQWRSRSCEQDKLFPACDSMAVTYAKLDNIFSSEEFQALDNQVQRHMHQECVPHFEFAGPSFNLAPRLIHNTEPYLSFLGVAMNPQSRGEIKLSSSDPNQPPHINPRLLDHPFDRRVIIEGVKAMMALHRTSGIQPFWEDDIMAPAGLSDDEIWEYVRANAQPALHAAGSLKMGSSDDKMACVDTNFKVRGLQSLRIADMSVCPMLMSNHPQSTAYLIGDLAVEKIVVEHST